MLKKAKTKLNIIRVFFIISYNVLQICDGQDFYHKCLYGAQNFRLPLNCLRSTKPRLLQMCCYAQLYSLIPLSMYGLALNGFIGISSTSIALIFESGIPAICL